MGRYRIWCMDIMERRIQRLVSLFAICFLVSCTTLPEEENAGPTEMTGEPVNIALKGQKEMCEREPESILCGTSIKRVPPGFKEKKVDE